MTVEWQYNGVAPFKYILSWCHETFAPNSWEYNKFETITFYCESDWVMFKLRWL